MDSGVMVALAWIVGVVLGAVVGHLRGNGPLGAIVCLMFGPVLGLWIVIAATRDGDNPLHGPPLLFYDGGPARDRDSGPIKAGSELPAT